MRNTQMGSSAILSKFFLVTPRNYTDKYKNPFVNMEWNVLGGY